MRIIAYLKSGCAWSQEVREIFRKYSLPCEEKDIRNHPENYAEMVRKSRQRLAPCVEIDGVMLTDVSGEDVENYLLSHQFVEPREKETEYVFQAPPREEEPAAISTSTTRFF